MEYWKQLQQHWLYEPSIWLLRSIFQPAGFNEDVETSKLANRMRTVVRLFFSMWMFSFPLALCVRIALSILLPMFYTRYGMHGNQVLEPAVLLFIFDALWATALSCLLGGLAGGIFGVAYSITLGMSFSVANGIIVGTLDDNFVGVVFGLSCGLFLGLTFNSVGAVKRSGLLNTTIGIAIGIIVGLLLGALMGVIGGYWPGIVVGIAGGSGLAENDSMLGSIAGTIVGGGAACLLMSLLGMVIRGSARSYIEVVDVGARIGTVVAVALGVAVGIPVGDVGMKQGTLLVAIGTGGMQAAIVGTAFLVGYIPGYYRLPLYPLTCIAMLRTYIYAQKNPLRILHYLRHSALHCDECVFLPLPYVKQMLLLAAEQNVAETLDEINFIIHERPQQRMAALAAMLEIALYDLSMRESLRDISRAHLRLMVTLPQEIRLFNPQIARLFSYLEDASRDAASYYTRMHWKPRRDALESMVANLKKIYPRSAFREPSLNQRLEQVVAKWCAVAKHEQDNVMSMAERLERIENPYTPGLVLELRDPLFVGRDDLAQQMGDALRRSRRPTFFLTGERRMGKSSILKQLPNLLGSHYLPIFYDLQSTGVASSSAALLGAIAEGIYDLLSVKGLPVRHLEYELLREDQRENEAVAYHRFNRWLKEVERILEQDDHTILLAFDEFEKLEEAAQKGHIDLDLLLDWFRSVIQNRPRVALLFSGVKTIGEMGTNWASYFVNVETLKVSFLCTSEAEQLILHPVPQFPGEQIFSPEVAAEILRITGCHPFLIQAVCSIIITHLNVNAREQAELNDVVEAEAEVFNRWGENYFEDLWERTDDAQRLCLSIVLSLQSCRREQILQQSGLDQATVHSALHKLVKRDLLRNDQGNYQLAAPIFAEWVRRNQV